MLNFCKYGNWPKIAFLSENIGVYTFYKPKNTVEMVLNPGDERQPEINSDISQAAARN